MTPQPFTHRRAAQAAIWLVAALLAAFVSLAGPHGGDVESAATTPVHAIGDGPGQTFSSRDGLTVGAATTFAGDDGPTHWLPAYRWQNAFQLQSQPDGGFFGMANVDTRFTSAISSMLFALAGFLWVLTLGLTRFAFTTDIVEMAGERLNVASAGLAESFRTSGLIAAVAALVLVVVALNLMRNGKNGGGPQTAIRNVALFLVPVAFMQILSANPAATQGQDGWDLSPVGLAHRGTVTVNDIVYQVTLPLTQFPMDAPADDANDMPRDVPSCEYYINRLYGTYHNTVGEQDEKAEAALVLVSRMWEATMLNSFTRAQYGIYSEGRFAACHQLEAQAHTPIAEQTAIAGGDDSPYGGMRLEGGTPSNVPDEEVPNYGCGYGSSQCLPATSHATSARTVFGTAAEPKHQIAYYLAWMACRNGDASAWQAAADAGDRVKNEYCENWFSDGFHSDDGGRFSNEDQALTFDREGDESPAAKLGGTETTEYKVVSTFMSGDGRFSLAGASVVTAGAYLVALGGLALGTIVATILLALLLLFAPATLLLLALPTKNGQRNALGMRMLRMTGTTLLAKLTFYLSITVMVLLINLLNGVVV